MWAVLAVPVYAQPRCFPPAIRQSRDGGSPVSRVLRLVKVVAVPRNDRGVFRSGSKAKRAAWGSGNNSCCDDPIVATPISNPGTPFAPGAVPQSRVWSRLCRPGLAGGRHWETGMLECGWPIGSATLRHGSWPPSASHGLAGTRTHALISCHGPRVLVSASGPAPRYNKTSRYQLCPRALRLHLQHPPTLQQVETALRKHTRTASSAPSPVHPVHPLHSPLRRPQPSRSLEPLHRTPGDYKNHEGPRGQDCLSLCRPNRQGPSFSTAPFWIFRPSPQEQVIFSFFLSSPPPCSSMLVEASPRQWLLTLTPLLTRPAVLSNTVNKTSLHPGGVQYAPPLPLVLKQQLTPTQTRDRTHRD